MYHFSHKYCGCQSFYKILNSSHNYTEQSDNYLSVVAKLMVAWQEISVVFQGNKIHRNKEEYQTSLK